MKQFFTRVLFAMMFLSAFFMMKADNVKAADNDKYNYFYSVTMDITAGHTKDIPKILNDDATIAHYEYACNTEDIGKAVICSNHLRVEGYEPGTSTIHVAYKGSTTGITVMYYITLNVHAEPTMTGKLKSEWADKDGYDIYIYEGLEASLQPTFMASVGNTNVVQDFELTVTDNDKSGIEVIRKEDVEVSEGSKVYKFGGYNIKAKKEGDFSIKMTSTENATTYYTCTVHIRKLPVLSLSANSKTLAKGCIAVDPLKATISGTGSKYKETPTVSWEATYDKFEITSLKNDDKTIYLKGLAVGENIVLTCYVNDEVVDNISTAIERVKQTCTIRVIDYSIKIENENGEKITSINVEDDTEIYVDGGTIREITGDNSWDSPIAEFKKKDGKKNVFIITQKNAGLQEFVFKDEYGKTAKLTVKCFAVVPTLTVTDNALVWNECAGATRYTVWRSEEENGGYVNISSVSGTKFVDESAAFGKNYYYMVKAEAQNSEFSSKYSNVVSLLKEMVVPSISKVENAYSNYTVTVSGQLYSGFEIYDGQNLVNATTKNTATIRLEAGNHALKVRAYQDYNGTKVYSDFSAVYMISVTADDTVVVPDNKKENTTKSNEVPTTTSNKVSTTTSNEVSTTASNVVSTTTSKKVAKPVISKVKKSKKKCKLTIKKVNGASKYTVMYSTSKKFKKGIVVSSKKNTITIKKLKVKKTYYFKVKVKVDNVESGWSKVKKVKL